MKKTFSENELQLRRGCYSREMIKEYLQGNTTVDIHFILDHPDMELTHKGWFLANKTELTTQQISNLAARATMLVLILLEPLQNYQGILVPALTDPTLYPQVRQIAASLPKSHSYAPLAILAQDPYDRLFAATQAAQLNNMSDKMIGLFKNFIIDL